MRDLDLLNLFTEQSAEKFKPAKLDTGRLDPNSFNVDLPAPSRQVFSNTIVAEPPAESFEQFSIAVPVLDDEPETETEDEADEEAVAAEDEAETDEADEDGGGGNGKQKLSYYNHQGDVPPGFKAAAACANCAYFICWEYEHEQYCGKYDFPCTPNYTCDDFKSRRQADEEAMERVRAELQEVKLSEQQESEEEAIVSSEEDKKEVYADDVQELLEEYKEVVQKFSDGALVNEMLTLTRSRFNKRSVFADAFLDMHYRNEYKRRNGTLEGAFTEV
jgi:hypothetical protein